MEMAECIQEEETEDNLVQHFIIIPQKAAVSKVKALILDSTVLKWCEATPYTTLFFSLLYPIQIYRAVTTMMLLVLFPKCV